MPTVDINDLASIGVVRDVAGYMLPPEAWTLGTNVRVQNEGVERIGGQAQALGTPGVAPHFAMSVQSPSTAWWLYTSLTKAYCYDGTTHTNITRQSAGVDVDYTASHSREWNGCLLGGVPILNNGVDVPQYWSALSAGTKLAVLPNWDANHRAAVIRPFGVYLIALYITKSGTAYPHMVKWSHPADPGTVPVTWDETDPVYDAGENDLPDVNAGLIRDGLPLRGSFYIYKDSSVWQMSFIGGTFVFSFQTLLETAGILAPRCVTMTGDGSRHVFVSQDDILVHNGNSVESILYNRYKKYLFNQIDPANYLNSFMFTNPLKNEVWFCYPEIGQTNPNKALIWNYREGVKGALTEADVNFRNAAFGLVETASTDKWYTVSGTWTTYVGPWSQTNRKQVILCGTDATKFFEQDSGLTRDGSAFSATLQRVGLSVEGRKRTGEWIVNHGSKKLVNRVWLKLEGGPVNVRIGFQEYVNGAVTWSSTKSFDPSTQRYVDVIGSGAALALEITSSDSVAWKLYGYQIDLAVVGQH